MMRRVEDEERTSVEKDAAVGGEEGEGDLLALVEFRGHDRLKPVAHGEVVNLSIRVSKEMRVSEEGGEAVGSGGVVRVLGHSEAERAFAVEEGGNYRTPSRAVDPWSEPFTR